jgi:hypothetical protein
MSERTSELPHAPTAPAQRLARQATGKGGRYQSQTMHPEIDSNYPADMSNQIRSLTAVGL